jgi:hypothetical protein
MRHTFVATVVLLLASPIAEARPFYFAVYKEVFPAGSGGVKSTYNFCHAGEKKTDLNAYAQRLREKLPAKNIRDADVIRRILQEIGPYPGTPTPEPSPGPK